MSLKPDLLASLRSLLAAKSPTRTAEDNTRAASHAAALADLQAQQAAEDAAVAAARAAEDAPILEAITAIGSYAPEGTDFQPAAA